MCQCRTPAGTPRFPVNIAGVFLVFANCLLTWRHSFLIHSSYFISCCWRISPMPFENRVDCICWIFLVCWHLLVNAFKEILQTRVMTTDAKCDEHTIFIHICTPPVPSNSFLTRLWNGGGEWVPGEWKLRVFLMFLYIFLPQKTACLPPKKNWESRNSSSSQQVEAKAIAK